MKKRLCVRYKGHVQGVGFRYVVVSVASGLNLTGWVKNSSDGTVEMVAEGDKKILDDLLTSIDDEFGSYITDKDIKWEEPTAEFRNFSIRF